MLNLLTRPVCLGVIGYLLFGIAIASLIAADTMHHPEARCRTLLRTAIGFALIVVLWPIALAAFIVIAAIGNSFSKS